MVFVAVAVPEMAVSQRRWWINKYHSVLLIFAIPTRRKCDLLKREPTAVVLQPCTKLPIYRGSHLCVHCQLFTFERILSLLLHISNGFMILSLLKLLPVLNTSEAVAEGGSSFFYLLSGLCLESWCLGALLINSVYPVINHIVYLGGLWLPQGFKSARTRLLPGSLSEVRC